MTTATIQETRAPGSPVDDLRTDDDARRQERPDQNLGSTQRVISTVGGAALALHGLKRADARGLAIAALGAMMMKRGVTGWCPMLATFGINTADDPGSVADRRITLHATSTVREDPDRIFELWRDPNNLPRFMTFLDGVEPLGDARARWHLHTPLGGSLDWEVEIVAEAEGELIAWQSVPDAWIHHEGEVRFRRAPAGRGTEIDLLLYFDPPAGKLGSAILSLFDGAAEMKLRGDLKRFKQWVETGEIATTEGQPTGR